MNIEEYRAMKAQMEKEEKEKESAKAEQPKEEVEIKEEQPKQEEVKDDKEEIKQNKTEEKEGEDVKEIKDITKPTDEIEIDGVGKIKVEEVLEWKNGYLRQSDYTKKTQEVSRLRKEAEEALELYNYLKANPHLAKKLAELDSEGVDVDKEKLQMVDPAMQKVNSLEQRLAEIQLERDIERLSQKYNDFEVREVLEVAMNEGITDLEKAYKLVKAEKLEKQPQTPQIDESALREKIRKELLEELKKEKEDTASIISSKTDTPPKEEEKPKLTPAEKKVAAMMGMSDNEYIKWKNIKRKS